MDLRDHVLSLHRDRLGFRGSEGGVQGRAVFRGVHPLPLEKGIDALLQLPGAGQRHECGQTVVGDPVLGIVQQQPGGFQGVARVAFRIFGEQFTHMAGPQVFGLLPERFPFRGVSQWWQRGVGHGSSP